MQTSRRSIGDSMKVGVVQLNLTNSIYTNKRKVLEYMQRAKNEGIEVLCFPETTLTGYVFDDFFKVDYGELESAIQEIHNSLIQSKLHAIIGTPYREDSSLYNSVVILLPDGNQLVYHKNILVSYEKRYFSQGDKRLVFAINEHKFGVMICRDQNSSEIARELKEMGAEGVFISAAHYYDLIESKMKRDKNCALPIVRAYENNFYVFKSNAVGTLYGRISFGNSMIVDPRGIVVLRAGEASEELLSYDIDFNIKNLQW